MKKREFLTLKQAIKLTETSFHVLIEIDNVVYEITDKIASLSTGQTLTLFYIINNLNKKVELKEHAVHL